MSENGGSNITIHICPREEEEEEEMLYRRQPVHFFSHNMYGGDEEKGIDMVGMCTQLVLGILQLWGFSPAES